MAPSLPSMGSEKMSSVPNADVTCLRGLDTLLGITRLIGKPMAAPMSE